MSIITVSRRPFSRGTQIAEVVAQRLGYECVAREVLFEAAKTFNVNDEAMLRAVHDAPSFSDHFHYGRERYVAYFQAALLDVLQRDDVVYHGLAGHFFVTRVSHALRVRIITSLEERVRVLTARENIGAKHAARIIQKEDRDRRRWSRHLYGVDTWDPALYHLVINIEELSVEEAAEIICSTVRMERFRTTAESRGQLADLVLAAGVKAALVPHVPHVAVRAAAGRVTVSAELPESEEPRLRQQIESTVAAMDGVEALELELQRTVRHHD